MSSKNHNSGAKNDMECAGLPAPCSPKQASANAISGASSAEQSGGKPPQSKPLNMGPQPLDKIMEEQGLKNHDLVAASTEGLTHKQVAKGRKGRRLTRNIQDKIADALSAKTGQPYVPGDLFTYR